MVNKRKSAHASPAMAVNLSRLQIWMPSAVHALSTRPDGKVVAVGREDGDVELRVPSEGYRVEARIPGQKGKGLRALAWMQCQGDGGLEDGSPETEVARLFGCGLDGTVFEVDLVRLCYKNVRDAYGGAAWCLRAADALSRLAVGCEDGSVRLFSTDGGGVEYKRSFSSTGSRVLSLAWGPRNEALFAGCADSMIHCLDASSGQGLFDMRLEGVREDGGGMVWALEALDDGTLVTGDSSGRVQVWDGLTGTQLQSLTTHEADVLCLCLTEGQREIFASGCDGKVVGSRPKQLQICCVNACIRGLKSTALVEGITFTSRAILDSLATLAVAVLVVSLERRQASMPTAATGGFDDTDLDTGAGTGGSATTASRRTREGWEWTLGSVRREHTHDVYALAIHGQSLEGRVGAAGAGAARKGPVLVSAGVDASLSLYSVPGFKTQGPRAIEPVPPIPNAFLAREPRFVLVMHNLHLDLWEIPRHARSFKAGLEDLEEDGALVDAGGGSQSPILRLSLEPRTDKGRHLACAAISADGGLIAVSTTKETKVYVLSRSSKSSSLAPPTISPRRLRLPGSCAPPAHALAFTPDGRRLVIAAAGGDIRVVDLGGGHGSVGAPRGGTGKSVGGEGARLVHCFEEHLDGVRPGGGDEGAVPVTMLAVSASGQWLVSASLSGVVYVFDLVKLRHHWAVPSFSTHRVLGLRFHCRDDILVCVDSSNAFRLLDVEQRRLAACHENVEFPLAPTGKGAWGGEGDVHPMNGVAFNPEDPLQSMLLFNHRSVMYVTPRRKIPATVFVASRPTSETKKRRPSEGVKAEKTDARAKAASNQSNFRMIRDFSSVVLLDFLGENELLVLENPWESVKESLPDVLDRKQYGV